MTDSYRGVTLWFTGLSQSGKTTTSAIVAERLRERGVGRLEVLDGDIMRLGLCRGLGFSKEDRDENIRRNMLVAQLLTRNDTVVIAALISPYAEARDQARAIIGDFLEIYCEASVEVCAERDTKGLYAKALAGELQGFTGVNDPYEAPVNPDLVLDTSADDAETCADRVIELMEARGYLTPVNDRVPAGATA
jgi:adenylylsulfate kinase